MKSRYEIAIVGSGFAGSLLARILTSIGYDVVLLERGMHPRFAIGESSTPLANLSLERIGLRYGLEDCYALAAHGRWVKRFPQLRRGLKRGFTFYRHHPGQRFEDRGPDSERLLVAASPGDAIADSHWFRADVDQHFVDQAVAAGVDYFDHVDLNSASFSRNHATLGGTRLGEVVQFDVSFVIDASGPGGFLARQLSLASDLARTHTRAALVFSHFDGVSLMQDSVPGLPVGPYPEDWAAVHHVIDEGWMYSLRFDHGTTSAGFLLNPQIVGSLPSGTSVSGEAFWQTLLARYPTIGDLFSDAKPSMPIAFRPLIQHRLAQSSGDRWLLMPHAFAFVDPLFSTGISWSLRVVERIALMFEAVASGSRVPSPSTRDRYSAALLAEGDQIDLLVAGAYRAMASFDLFSAQAMLYFAAVSFAEASQRLQPDDSIAWRGFLGVGDPVLEPLPRESLRRLEHILAQGKPMGAQDARRGFVEWVHRSIKPRNVAGLGDPKYQNLYPVDFDALLDAHTLLGMSRHELLAALPALRGSPLAEAIFSLTTATPDRIVGAPKTQL
ncbi:MAG: NAD(P)/FAD-dependent oxidoreductase [Gemmatimonadaceae bacterium]